MAQTSLRNFWCEQMYLIFSQIIDSLTCSKVYMTRFANAKSLCQKSILGNLDSNMHGKSYWRVQDKQVRFVVLSDFKSDSPIFFS